MNKDVVIIGGGCAGMAAALGVKKHGIHDVLILERDQELGGILQQCIHNGFGLQIFKEELSGPAYAERYQTELEQQHIEYRLNSTVLEVSKDLQVTYVNEKEGYVNVQAKAIIFACGCYERSAGAISIPGDRPKGVYTAGTAQRYLNMDNVRVGEKVFILGSGDIGLIMARRMTLEGAIVLGVAELMPYSNGLQRNIVQCLEDFDIPLYLSHTVTSIKGKDQLKQITIMAVDEHRQPISGSEKQFDVDTLLLSVGLIPESQLEKDLRIEIDPHTKGAIVDEHYQTNIPHIYACGNALHVHDLADFVCMEAQQCGMFVAKDIQTTTMNQKHMILTKADEGINYVLPQHIHADCDHDVELCFRVKKPYKECCIEIYADNQLMKTIKKRYVLPAEMEKIKMKQEELNENIKELILKVREVI